MSIVFFGFCTIFSVMMIFDLLFSWIYHLIQKHKIRKNLFENFLLKKTKKRKWKFESTETQRNFRDFFYHLRRSDFEELTEKLSSEIWKFLWNYFYKISQKNFLQFFFREQDQKNPCQFCMKLLNFVDSDERKRNFSKLKTLVWNVKQRSLLGMQ